jgi:hypothetical protein
MQMQPLSTAHTADTAAAVAVAGRGRLAIAIATVHGRGCRPTEWFWFVSQQCLSDVTAEVSHSERTNVKIFFLKKVELSRKQL